MKLGEKLNEMISKKGMSVNQVATIANVPPSSLYSIITRNSTKVDIDSFIRICNVLECRPEDFSDEILAAKPKTPAKAELTEDELTVINTMRNMNEDGVHELLQYCEYLNGKLIFKKESDSSRLQA